jgi:hypothetical protein
MRNFDVYKLILCSLFISTSLFAGNDNKRGQAGATELLMNPWSRSTGFAGANTAMVTGVESMRLNVAGLSQIQNTEVVFSNSNWLGGAGVSINSVGFGQKIGENGGVMGVSLMSMNFGEFIETTTDLPEGTGSTFSPNFFNIGISYSKVFSNSISGGITLRLISESIPQANAQGIAFDGGVQYQTGDRKQFKFGVAMRNLGPTMRYSGDGLSFRGAPPQGGGDYQLRIDQRSDIFEIPSLMNIGVSYDFQLGVIHRLTPAANFVSSTFTNDHIQLGMEYGFKNFLMLRAGFDYRDGIFDSETRTDAFNGPAFGATIQYPFGEEGEKSFGVDFSYRTTEYFSGTTSIGLILSL